MNRAHRLNESFSTYMEGMITESLSANDELFLEMCNALDSVVTTGVTSKDTKIHENTIKQIVENFTGKDFWDVSDVNVYEELLIKTPHDVAREISNSIKLTEDVQPDTTEQPERKSLTEATRYDKEMAKKNPKTAEDKAANKALNQKIVAATQSKADARKYKDDIERAIPGAEVDLSDTAPSIKGPNGMRISRADNGYGGYAKNSINGPAASTGHHKGWRNPGRELKYAKGEMDSAKARYEQSKANKPLPTKTIGDMFREYPELQDVEAAQKALDDYNQSGGLENDRDYSRAKREYEYQKRRAAADKRESRPSNRREHELGGRVYGAYTNLDYERGNDRQKVDKIDFANFLSKKRNDEYHHRNNRAQYESDDYQAMTAEKRRINDADWSRRYHQKNIDAIETEKEAARKRYEAEINKIESRAQYDRKSLVDADKSEASAKQKRTDILNKHRAKRGEVKESALSMRGKRRLVESMGKTPKHRDNSEHKTHKQTVLEEIKRNRRKRAIAEHLSQRNRIKK